MVAVCHADDAPSLIICTGCDGDALQAEVEGLPYSEQEKHDRKRMQQLAQCLGVMAL